VISKRALVVGQKWPKKWPVSIWLLLALPGASASESWREVLARMPLRQETRQLNRTNCVELMLSGLQSNAVVKALIFMPGATDEFYMYRRAEAQLTNASPSLLQAIDALTSQTRIRATFRSPMLLLHTEDDRVEPKIVIQDEPTANRIRNARLAPHIVCNDATWEYLQPILRWSMGVDIRPWHNSTDSWHFYRHSFAGWGLNGWEGLEAAALAGKTRFTVKRKSVVFELDTR
jgi:hypothetical protein